MEKEESEILTREQCIFGEYPVPKAVASMIIPTIISQIITVIYNLADGKHDLSAMEKLFAEYINGRLDLYLSMLQEK